MTIIPASPLFLYNYGVTLTQTAVLTKKLILISAIAIFASIIGLIGYNVWRAYYLASLPPVEEKPDLKFGLLPKPDFSGSDVSSSNFSYSLDTTTGGMPKIGQETGFDKLIKVYFITQTFTTLLSSDRASTLAEKFNFFSPPEILNETKYKYQNKEKTLTVDLDTGNFIYIKEATISAESEIDKEAALVAGFKQILSYLGVSKQDIAKGRSKIIQLENKAVQISLWPDSIDKKIIYSNEFDKALINAEVYGSANKLENYRSINFTYYPVDLSTFATYPLKNPDTAFNDLKTGNGIIIASADSPQISITSVSLGYYMSKNYNPYLLPIYIFEGPDFIAYVDAISNQFHSDQ